MTHTNKPEYDSQRRDRLEGDPALDRLVREIFEIIPSYYDEREAERVALLIRVYLRRQLAEASCSSLPLRRE